MSDPALTLTVVGCGPAWTNPGEPCSSYLVEAGGVRILVDCGSGAFAALQEVDPRPLDAVVLSHLHFDHCGDLIPFAYSRMYAGLRGWTPRACSRPRAVSSASPRWRRPGVRRAIISTGPFSPGEYQPGVELELGAARLTFAALRHPGVSHAIRIEAGGQGALLLGRHRSDARARRARAGRGRPALRGDVCRPLGIGRRAPLGGGRGSRRRRTRVPAAAARARRRGPAGGGGRRRAYQFGGRLDAAVPGFRVEL